MEEQPKQRGENLKEVGSVESFVESVTNEGPPLEYQRIDESIQSQIV
jgi:hypothetical protein